MLQNSTAGLLRQIGSALPGDGGNPPEEISELSFAQVCLLGELFEQEKAGREPLSLSALSQETGFSKATVCATLKKLRKAGYVRVRMNSRDNRRKEIILTRQAWTVASSITQYVFALDCKLCAGISANDVQIMKQSLLAILQNAKGSAHKVLE